MYSTLGGAVIWHYGRASVGIHSGQHLGKPGAPHLGILVMSILFSVLRHSTVIGVGLNPTITWVFAMIGLLLVIRILTSFNFSICYAMLSTVVDLVAVMCSLLFGLDAHHLLYSIWEYSACLVLVCCFLSSYLSTRRKV